MKNKKLRSVVSLLLTAAMLAGSVPVTEPVKAEETDTTTETIYYIDAANGDDANDGKSEDTAWKTFKNIAALDDSEATKLNPGDKVLLKKGCEWSLTAEDGPLLLENAVGTKENPIVLGAYDDKEDANAKNPVIHGNGNPWNDEIDVSTLAKEDVAAVHVKNSAYITIENLEVTNWEADTEDLMGEKPMDENGKGYDQSKSMLTGILVENCDGEELEGVVIQNNYVHNVNGYMSKNGTEGHKKGSGGIMVLVTTDNNTTQSSYKDLRIIGNEVENVCHEAIYMESCWAARPLVGGANSQQAGKLDWVGWENVYVAENYVHDVAGDGIVLINCDGGVAEKNLLIGCAKEAWNYSRNPAHAAIWMWDCNNVTMQYNEASHTESTQDGMAFDSDYGNQNVMYQYNYSHDNKGGFWMACPGPYYSVNSVVRYNVSVNDAGYNGGRILHVGEYGSIGHQVYNNTIYWNNDHEVAAVEQGGWTDNKVPAVTSGTDIYNNIFYGNNGTFIDNEGTTYKNNCVWGGTKDSYIETVDDPNAVIADPQFINVEKGSGYTNASVSEDGKIVFGTVDGFQLNAASECINAGRAHMAVPFEWFDADLKNDTQVKSHIELATVDYAGNPIVYKAENTSANYVDIGAFEYQGVGTAPAIKTDKAYLQALTNMASAYKAESFTAATWESFSDAFESAKAVINRPNATQTQVDENVPKLEEAMKGLKKVGAERPGTVEDNILATYKSSANVDNSGFESSAFDWSYYQASREISSEQAHGDSAQSLKITKDSGKDIGYSELSEVPVEMNTTYICEAWLYCGDKAASNVGFEAKHHENYAGSKIELGTAEAVDVEGSTWKKVTMEFTTKGYELISIAASSKLDVAYLDDVVLYPKTVVIENLDRTALEAVVEISPEHEESYYAPGTWKKYQEALAVAKLKIFDAMATQEEINQTVLTVNNAYAALAKKAESGMLSAVYQAYLAETQTGYTSASWSVFQTAMQNAKIVIDNVDATQTQVNDALESLINAAASLVVENVTGNNTVAKTAQVITVKDNFEKAYGDKSFKISAKLTTGNGSLKFASSDESVATVSATGKVSIKGTGACKITVTATETSTYNAATADITIKVAPRQAELKSVKAAKGKKMTVKWTKDKTASGYEIQYSTSKKFKSAKTTDVNKASKASATIKKLKKGKKYYVRVRAYKNATVDGAAEKLCGEWSKAKRSAKIK
ncbi:MAG: FIVAR domain-containing protein [Lachnospiraceae bacterium]|nr:FIVAR domain-containing protein [Lachnospiraceae bacterium]